MQDIITVLLDGTELPDLRIFFKKVVADLDFPKHTIDIATFEEQINDLSWLDGAKVRMSISNAKDFLIEEDAQVRKTMLGILLAAMENEERPSPLLVIISKD